MSASLASALIGCLVGATLTGFLASLTFAHRLSSIDARLGLVERTLREVTYVRVRHRPGDFSPPTPC